MKRLFIALVCGCTLSTFGINDLNAQDSLSAYILTPKPGPAPKINGPKSFGVRPGHPIVFTVPASGTRPLEFSAKNLPPGVKLSSKTGQISGSITKAGEYTVTIEAKNSRGKTSRPFKIVVGETIALTPPMGWNSWNIYSGKVTQELVLANAKAMSTSGLINHGWTYMNIDDVWQGKRGGEFFAILPDSTTFPDMQGLVNEIHRLGLKAGIYSTPWIESYGHRIGGSAMNEGGTFEPVKENVPRREKKIPYAIGKYVFVENDVKQWAKWGFDYLKYDWNPVEYPETKLMYEALRNSGRDIVFSLSNSTPFASVKELSTVSNAWRTGGDIRDNWKSLKSRLLTQDKWAPYARPGHWNDPDMMIVGWVGWGKTPRPTMLTADEQYSHMSAWCLQSVPLLLGNDLTKLDDFTLSLLTNDEVIDVNQDPLGKQATMVARVDSCGVLAKDLEDGSKAAGLFNVTDSLTRKLSVKWSELGIRGKYIVRDLWRQKDLGTFEEEFSAEVKPHGVVMIRLRKAK
ncbi:alpha-galactosidase [Segetibacter sp. 3557_3]|uniref:putative Ig domain-containing protein n=1 Tax=Segetibacter sp. 3557_3 TaxID=2547429 RepID=UPI001058E962|nr:putative Ig domain-containing protein [Segetibacter sp. 3557_3]TDH20076.1 alpha-galactosidase [Segetibacter sp. 3557_3]